MPENQSPTTLTLTVEEEVFAASLVSFFGSLEGLAHSRRRLQEAGGNELRAFLSTVPVEARADAAMQWPMLSLMLDSLKNVG